MCWSRIYSAFDRSDVSCDLLVACCSSPIHEDLVAVTMIIHCDSVVLPLEADPLLSEPATASGCQVEDDDVVGTAEPNLQDDSAIRTMQIHDGVDGRGLNVELGGSNGPSVLMGMTRLMVVLKGFW